MGIKYIDVIIDTFTRYIELFPKQGVTTIAAGFTAPLELVTDFDSQFVNDLHTHFQGRSNIMLRYRTQRKKME